MHRRIAEALTALGVPAQARILLALSGGADSTALLLSLHALGREVCALHVHHGIRGAEADRDAEFCRSLCGRLGVPFSLARTDVPALAAERGLGIEQCAREERYRLLAQAAREHGCSCVATAHNLEDHAETVLLHLVRGSGLDGLCGIPPVREGIIRPMLGISRRDIEAYLDACGQSYVTDSTNLCQDYTRNRIRSRILPELCDINPAFPQAVYRMSRTLREDAACLNALEAQVSGPLSVQALCGMPVPVAARVLRRAYNDCCGLVLSADATRAALELIRSDRPSGELHLPACRLCRSYDALHFTAAEQPSPMPERPLAEGKYTPIPEAGLKIGVFFDPKPEIIHNSLNSFHISCDRIDGHLVARPRRAGDSFQKSPKAHRRSLKKLLIDEKYPRRGRDLLPVIADGNRLLALCGHGADAAAAARPGEPALLVDVRPL